MLVHFPALAASLFLLAACSGGSGLSSSLDKPATKKKAASADSQTPPTDAKATQDSEGSKATAPVQVTGAFLTSQCDVAVATDFTAISGQEAYGCAINNADGSKYAGIVQFTSIAVNYAKDTPVAVALNATPASSRWHTYFYLPLSAKGQIKSYQLAGTLDSQRSFNLVYSPGTTSAAADNTIASAPAAAATSCVTSSDYTLASPAYPFSMDAQNTKDRQFNFTTAGGSPIPVLDSNGGFKPGDSLTGSATGTTSVAIDASNGVADKAYQPKCPLGWKLFFQDVNANILNSTNGDLSAWMAPNKGTIPAGAVTATIGYSETSDKTYQDNEGNLLGLGIYAYPTGGCHFTFHIDRVCK